MPAVLLPHDGHQHPEGGLHLLVHVHGGILPLASMAAMWRGAAPLVARHRAVCAGLPAHGGGAHHLSVFYRLGCRHHGIAPLAPWLDHGTGDDGHVGLSLVWERPFVVLFLWPPCRDCRWRMEHAALLCRVRVPAVLPWSAQLLFPLFSLAQTAHAAADDVGAVHHPFPMDLLRAPIIPEPSQQDDLGLVSGGRHGSVLLCVHQLATAREYGCLALVARLAVCRHGLCHGRLNGTLCPAHRAAVCPGGHVCVVPLGRGTMAAPFKLWCMAFILCWLWHCWSASSSSGASSQVLCQPQSLDITISFSVSWLLR